MVSVTTTAFLLVFIFGTASAQSGLPRTLQNNTSTETHAALQSSPDALSGLTVFYSLLGLAINAAMQRSGADELPGPSLSLARTSPFICGADILVAFMTQLYAYRRGLGFHGACALYIHNTRHCSPDIEPLEFGARMIFDLLAFVAGLVGVMNIFAAQHVDAQLIVWASLLFAAPLVYAVPRMIVEDPQLRDRVQEHLRLGHGEQPLQVADWCWCIAYVVQFLLWVRVIQGIAALPLLSSATHARWFNIAVAISIATATLVSVLSKKRMFKYWSLSNWDGKARRIVGISGVILAMAAGFPDNPESAARWHALVFLPLGAFSICVLELWLVTLLMDLLDLLRRRLRTPWSQPLPSKEQPSQDAPVIFADRFNPLLRTAPEYWRGTLMITFAACQLTFAALSYTLLYKPGDATDPGWTDGFGG